MLDFIERKEQLLLSLDFLSRKLITQIDGKEKNMTVL